MTINHSDLGGTEAAAAPMELPQITEDDMVIAVMGVTGAGKSTFIQHFTKANLIIGHSLVSCTAQVAIYPCELPDGTKLYLVDTPGFDDTYRTDTDILREIANWLVQAYENKIQLTGIIYLHRILDPRVGGKGMKNLRMFRKLCGDNGLGSVVLATTMWSLVTDLNMAEQRESELMSMNGFWQDMIQKGSKVFRQDTGRESAAAIVQYLVGRRRKVTLDIQTDMVDRGLSLDETAAGQEMQEELAKQRKYYEQKIQEIREDMKEALANRDSEHQRELEEYKAEIEEKMARDRADLAKIRADKDELREQLAEQYAREREELMEKIRETERMVVKSEMDTQLMVMKHEHELELTKLKHELDMKEFQHRMMADKKEKKKGPCIIM